MKAGLTNIWFGAAAWWTIMVVLGAAFMIPIFSWDSTVQFFKILISPAVALLALGLFLENPQRYLAYLALVMAFIVVPATLVCLAPLVSLVFFMSARITIGFLALLIFALATLSLWFVVRRVIRENKQSIKPADS